MMPTKACPVVFRDSLESQILVFRHPLAAIQLVKGTIEAGESSQAAALRELSEESGIHGATVVRDLGLWDAGYDGHIWSFHVCRCDRELPPSWHHQCADDGGLDLQFFWHTLDDDPTEDWHPVFRNALAFIRGRMTTPTQLFV